MARASPTLPATVGDCAKPGDVTATGDTVLQAQPPTITVQLTPGLVAVMSRPPAEIGFSPAGKLVENVTAVLPESLPLLLELVEPLLELLLLPLLLELVEPLLLPLPLPPPLELLLLPLLLELVEPPL